MMDPLDRRLLDEFQRDLPLVSRPYLAMGEQLGISEDEVILRLERLRLAGSVARVGAVVRPHAAGASTLAAMAVPPVRLDEVAALVSAYPQVNHNYQREHRLNLWFVVAAGSQSEVAAVLDGIARQSGLAVLDLPMLEDFHIDLGFGLSWT
ncbi:AsnC family transcriptional regulator [Magnetospirillum moscoviense]|uniref:siroheme decarboxylase n=1 Tax=Magnetospirillum moscoviense TaxID=1437059 RepID=A0A178MZ39_9PROT|nr:AsnC family transcriptional regulator [Magnetospirillum moscoviense]OAN63206.1 AsnC family transcriptional regulator [Magnetospirillum moscoviense]